MVDAIGRAVSTGTKAIQKAKRDTKDFRDITGNISHHHGSHILQKGVNIVAVKGGRSALGADYIAIGMYYFNSSFPSYLQSFLQTVRQPLVI